MFICKHKCTCHLFEEHRAQQNTHRKAQEHEYYTKQSNAFFQSFWPNQPYWVQVINNNIVIAALIVAIGRALLSISVAFIEQMDYNNQFEL